MSKTSQRVQSMRHMAKQDARKGYGKRWRRHPLKAVYDAAYKAERSRMFAATPAGKEEGDA